MLITVSGPPGSGKSTVAGALATAFECDHVSGGDIFRSLADERGLTPLEFNHLAEEDDQIDRDLDRRQIEVAAAAEDLVLESRLAGWLAGEHADFRVWLDAPLDVRAARIADREGTAVPTAREETAERAASEAGRYETYYGIDIDDLSIYDLHLNTARWTADAVVDVVTRAVAAYDPDADEGSFPVPLDPAAVFEFD